MRILLDTHMLIWCLIEPSRLSDAAAQEITDPRNSIVFSAASIWEMAIKSGLGRLRLKATPAEILQGAVAVGFVELPVRAEVGLRVAALPYHHRDPFDRLLVAQAMAEPAELFTADAQLAPYSQLVRVI